MTISAYLRTAPPALPGQHRNDMGNDILLSSIKFHPSFSSEKILNEWLEATAGKGYFHIQATFKPTQVCLTHPGDGYSS